MENKTKEMAQSLTEIYAKQFASFLAIGNGRNDQEDSVKCQFYYPDGPNPSKPNNGGEMCADAEAQFEQCGTGWWYTTKKTPDSPSPHDVEIARREYGYSVTVFTDGCES